MSDWDRRNDTRGRGPAQREGRRNVREEGGARANNRDGPQGFRKRISHRRGRNFQGYSILEEKRTTESQRTQRKTRREQKMSLLSSLSSLLCVLCDSVVGFF